MAGQKIALDHRRPGAGHLPAAYRRHPPAFPFLFIVALLLISALSRIVTVKIQKLMKRDVAEIKAEDVRNLMKGKWKSDNETIRKTIARDLEKIGDGALDGVQIPVITVIDNEQPFSGYGRLQAESLFICRPIERENNVQQAYTKQAVVCFQTRRAATASLSDAFARNNPPADRSRAGE